MPITPLPAAPETTDTPQQFNTKAFAWVQSLDTFVTEANAQAATVDSNASSASSSASSASASASSASTSASNAATSATNSANSATSAANAQAGAEAALAEFNATYLGAQSSDPALDNEGDPVTAGDWYFNTTTNLSRIYDGSSWQNIIVSTANLLQSANNLSDLVNIGTARTNLGLAIGSDVQAYDADTAKTDIAQTFTAQQTFTEVKDTVHTITDGAGFQIDPANGSIQVVTLGASRTPAATNFEAGQVVLLGIDDGSAYTITWTTVAVTWVTVGGTASAPTLATSGYTWVLLWKVASTIYGAEVGSP